MSEYKSNSNRAKEAQEQAEERRVEKVVTGSVTQRKRGWLETFVFGIFKQSDAKNLEDFFMQSMSDMFCHGIGTISDIICNAINMKMTGEPIRRRSDSSGVRINYRQYYQEQQNERKEYAKSRNAAPYSYDDLVFDNRGDAEEVLYQMQGMLQNYQAVSVGDLFDFAGVKSDYTSQKYGWTNLDDARVERARGGGYIINLPRATGL